MKKTARIHAVIFLVLAGIFLGNANQAQAQTTADTIIGEWLNEAKDRKMQVYKKTDNTYEGKMSWAKNTSDKSKPGIGTVVIKGLKYEDGWYIGGKVYAPKFGGWIKCSAQLKNNGTLAITGSKGLFSKTQTWTR